MRRAWSTFSVTCVAVSLFVVPARAGDGGVWSPIAVNHPQGIACPAMFGGAQGVCWPLNEAVDLQRIVGKRLPDAEAALAEAKAALEDRGEEATQLREAIARLTGEKVALDKALAASEKRAEILQASCSPSGWKLLLSFVGGGLTAVGLSWGLRR